MEKQQKALAKPAASSAASIRRLATIGVMSAVTCVLAPFSIPIGPVPISLTSLVVYFSPYLLGMSGGMASYLIYLLIGLIGVPVFSSFTSGPEKLLGPTGGYLIGFIPTIAIAGVFIDKFAFSNKGDGAASDSRSRNLRRLGRAALCFLGMVLGTVVLYLFGTAWLSYQSNMDFSAALAVGVLPFIPGDTVKMLLAASIGSKIRRQLVQAGVAPRP